MKRWAPSWDDDLPPAPDTLDDPTPTPEEELDTQPRGARGHWGRQYVASRSHSCDATRPECPREIARGDLYWRNAVLERPKGGRRGTVTVTRTCQHCTAYP